MLNRLAAYSLRCNPKVTAALRLTYAYVFLDEFQDTTASQWDLVRAAFLGSRTVLTAVGDSKQRIMVWAGAKTDVFEKFQEEFSAERADLVRNYRSVPELVRMQYVIAQALEAGSVEAVAASTREGSGVWILEFGIGAGGCLLPIGPSRDYFGTGFTREFCVLVRQRVGAMVALLQRELGKGHSAPR